MTEDQRAITLLALLRRTTQEMVNELSERMNEAGRPTHMSFHYVFENIDPEGTRLTTLATRSGLTHQSMGELVGRMEDAGYVERIPDPDDRRARLVRLTDEGRDHVRAAIREIRAVENRWRSRWRRAGLTADLEPILAAALGDSA